MYSNPGSRRLWVNRILLFSPVLLAFLVMLPRLFSPQFGLLDDGVTLRAAQAVSQNIKTVFLLSGDTGRFFPAYWLFYWLVYLVGGSNPFFFFVANTLLLALISTGLIWLVRVNGGTRLPAWASGLFFVLAGPVVESFYTISKPEPLQLFWFTASWMCAMLYARSSNFAKRAVACLAVAGALTFACLTKETSLVIIPISFGWFLLGLIGPKSVDKKRRLQARGMYVVAGLTAGIAFFILRSSFVHSSISAGTYTTAYSLDMVKILLSASRWGAWLIRDFAYLFPLVLFLGVSILQKRQFAAKLWADAGVWMLGWCAIFLPWHSTLEYYLLPFALGCAVFGGVVIGQIVSVLKLPGKKLSRTFAGICLAVSLVAMLPVLCNNLTNAQLQLAVDAANSDMVSFLSTLPPNSRVLVNLPKPNEYVYEIQVHLSEIKKRPDILVDYFKFQVASPIEPDLSYYVASPLMENRVLPSVRIAVSESGAEQWGQSLQSFAGDGVIPVYQTERHAQMLDFGLHRLICLLPHSSIAGIYCDVARPFIDGRQFSYGWQIYQLSSEIDSVMLPAIFSPDMGAWEFQLADGSSQQVRWGQKGDVPIVGDWNGDGSTDIGLFRPDELTWYLDQDFDGQSDVAFQFLGMEPTDIPLTGDWNGDGISTPGYFRPKDASWHWRNTHTTGAEDWPVIYMGASTDIPLVGDWDSNGYDTPGIYRPENGLVNLKNDLTSQLSLQAFGAGTALTPVVGDWGGQGVDSIAFVVDRQWTRRFVNCNCSPSNPSAPFEFGSSDGIPLAGKWEVK